MRYATSLLVVAMVAATAAWLLRWDMNASSTFNTAYTLDRWTGKVVFYRADAASAATMQAPRPEDGTPGKGFDFDAQGQPAKK